MNLRDEAFGRALQSLAEQKQCDGITVGPCGIFFKRNAGDVVRIEESAALTYHLAGGAWSAHEGLDFRGNDVFCIYWGAEAKTIPIIDPLDLAFITAMQAYADEKGYRGIQVSADALAFKYLGGFSSGDDIREQTTYSSDSTVWIKREACHGIRNLLSPVEQFIQEASSAIVTEANRDPLPQFTSEEVHASTEFLIAAIVAMESFVSAYTGDDFPLIRDEQIEARLRLARESARRLTLLLARDECFAGTSVSLMISESQQADDMRAQLKNLQSFFQTFAGEEWLGRVLATEDFAANQQTAMGMLGGLLQPTKFTIEDQPAAQEVCESVLSVLSGLQSAPGSSSDEQLGALADTMTELSEVFRAAQQARIDMQTEITAKMTQLQRLADTLTRFPPALNRYLLVRLGEIDADLTVLKQWVRRQEATEVHQLLESFRDAAIREQAVRLIAARMERGSSVASSDFQFLPADRNAD